MQTLFQDLRYGSRQLLKRPGFTFLAIISMALGIGANTAIFSLVDTVLLRPLPVRNASELQELYGTLHNGADYTLQSYLNYKDYRDRNQVFSGVIAYRIVVASLSHMVARTKSDPRTALAAMQRELRGLDPTLPLYEVKTLTEHMKIPLFPAQMTAGALGSFGVLALVLAAVGIYGVMSYVVAGRTREIGLRMALGAQSGNVRNLILRQGMTLAFIGSVIGLAIAFGATRLLKSVLYGVSASDPVTFVGVTFLLASVALFACWLPARRATRVDPMIALRAE